MKKYSFSITKKEIIDFSIRAVLAEIYYQFATWIVIGLVAGPIVLILCALLSVGAIRELADIVMEILAIRWLGIILAVFFLGLIIVMLFQSYLLKKKSLYGKTQTIWVEDDLLKVDDGEVYREMPCINVRVINQKRNLIILGVYQAEEHLAWYYIPLRVFSDVQEMFEFLKMIRYSRESYMYSKASQMNSGGLNYYSMPADDKEDVGESELFHFSFWIDEERWKRALIDTKDIIRSGVLGSYKKNKVILAVFGIVFLIFICGYIFSINSTLLFIIFMALLFMLNLASKNMVSPEKVIKTQWKNGLMQKEDYGKWKVSVSETGVTCKKPNLGRTTILWNKFSSMVETDTAFYLFWNDKKHFVMILKECIENYVQADVLKQICVEKNIAVTMSKKVKHVPYWVFTLLLAVLILIFLLYFAGFSLFINSFIQNSRL